MNLNLIILFCSLFLIVSCSKADDKKEVKESAFQEMYQLSEMALFMEEIYDFYKENRELISTNDSIAEIPDFLDKIYTSEMTDGFEHSELMRNYSDVFIKNVKLLHNSEGANKVELYNDVVNSCIACHTSDVGCIGPVPRIKKLLIE